MQRKQRPHRQSPDLNQTKVTPRTRPTHEAAHDGSLVNPDPTRKYVLAPMDDQHPMNWQYYESMGYEVVKRTPDGVKIRMGDNGKVGDPLKWRGNVLLSCSAERAQEIFESGPTGLTGQKYYDKLMEQIRRNELEKRVNVHGTREELDVSELEQVGSVFRE